MAIHQTHVIKEFKRQVAQREPQVVIQLIRNFGEFFTLPFVGSWRPFAQQFGEEVVLKIRLLLCYELVNTTREAK